MPLLGLGARRCGGSSGSVSPRRAGSWLLLLLFALSGFQAGCEDDQPSECETTALGEFSFLTDPPDTVQWSGTLQTATRFGGPSPTWEYEFLTNGNRAVRLLVPEIGPSAPIVEGEFYTVEARIGGTDPHDSFGLRVTDAVGLRFLAVSDWKPGFSMFIPGATQVGYALTGNERLGVYESNPGCKAIEENTARYLVLKNRSLRFVVEGEGAADLFNGQSATLGNWVIHVHKTIEVVPKDVVLVQNQLSFSVEREGLR